MNQPVYVFIVKNFAGSLHVGLTRNLVVTLRQLKERAVRLPGAPQDVDHLIFFRECETLEEGIRFETTLRQMSRHTLVRLAQRMNPWLHDLSDRWFKTELEGQDLRLRVVLLAMDDDELIAQEHVRGQSQTAFGTPT